MNEIMNQTIITEKLVEFKGPDFSVNGYSTKRYRRSRKTLQSKGYKNYGPTYCGSSFKT